MAKEIPLTRGMVAIVDDADFAELSKFKWYAGQAGRGKFYPVSNIKGQTVRMHTFLLGKSPGLVVDHRDRDGMNNQRSNLRRCTQSQNMANQKVRGGKSKFKGVWLAPNGKWSVTIGFKQKVRYLGTFISESDAAKAYDAEAVKLYGEFAYLNFPQG